MITKWPAGFNKEKALLGAYSVRYSRRFVDSSSWDESREYRGIGVGAGPLVTITTIISPHLHHCPLSRSTRPPHDHIQIVRSQESALDTGDCRAFGSGVWNIVSLFSSKNLYCKVDVPPARDCMYSIVHHRRGRKWSTTAACLLDVITCYWGKLEWVLIVLVTGVGDTVYTLS